MPTDHQQQNDHAWDHRSIKAVENGLWCAAMCRCEKCDVENKSLPDCSESPWNGDAISWSNEWAPKAQADGWAFLMTDSIFSVRNATGHQQANHPPNRTHTFT
jgi:hypothetical protein